MIAYKASILLTFLFVGLFASGLSYENETEHNSLKSYGGTSCTLPEVSNQLRLILSEVEIFGGVTKMDFNYTLRFARKLTGLYFTSSCGAPIFYNLYDKFSEVRINMNVAAYVHNGMVTEMTSINKIVDSTGTILIDDLLDAINQVAHLSSVSFTFAYNYIPIQWLICNQWLALSVLATKAPGANQTAMEEMLKNTIHTCSTQLNRKEHEMLVAFDNRDVNIGIWFEANVGVSYRGADTFTYQFYCAKKINSKTCIRSCADADLAANYESNPFTKTYGNVFDIGYCRMRKTFSLFNNTDNVIAAKCLDSDFYVEKDFLTLVWHSKVGPGGASIVTYDKGSVVNDGLFLPNRYENIFLDLVNGQVKNDTDIKCKNVQFLTRCEVPLPPLKGSCYA